MDDKNRISTEEHGRQIELYGQQIGDCKLYADVLKRILGRSLRRVVPRGAGAGTGQIAF